MGGLWAAGPSVSVAPCELSRSTQLSPKGGCGEPESERENKSGNEVLT